MKNSIKVIINGKVGNNKYAVIKFPIKRICVVTLNETVEIFLTDRDLQILNGK